MVAIAPDEELEEDETAVEFVDVELLIVVLPPYIVPVDPLDLLEPVDPLELLDPFELLEVDETDDTEWTQVYEEERTYPARQTHPVWSAVTWELAGQL